MDQYLENLEVFYDEKMKYLTKRNKFINCQTCDTEKIFKESKEELILSCGSGIPKPDSQPPNAFQ